jgi:ABC-2 type transport system permease protein
MLDAIRAGSLKLRRHRATWFMVWIYPIGVGLLVVAQLARDLTSAAVATPLPITADAWVEQSAIIWGLPISGPGRFLLAGFAALVFAGEFGWNTWKLIIPGRTRWELIAAKWIVSFGLVFIAFVTADLIGLLGTVLRSSFGGPAVPAELTFAAVADAHAAAAAHALLPILYTIVGAGLLATLTTSVLATAVLSIGLIVLEQLLPAFGAVAHTYAPSLTLMLLQSLPFYHLANLIAWAKGVGLTVPLDASSNLAASWLISMAAVLAWIGGISAATIAKFNRQDLN